MANDNVFILFEELKSILKGIANKLEELPKIMNGLQSIKDNKQDLSPIKELLAKQLEANIQVFNTITKRVISLDNTLEQISNQWQRIQVLQQHIHKHNFDFKSNKVLFFVVGIGFVYTVSLWSNIELWKSKRQYEDNALKFKFIRANKGYTSKDILWLNEVFDIHRSKSGIKWIEEQVEHYNSSLKATSDSLMQMRLQENKNPK